MKVRKSWQRLLDRNSGLSRMRRNCDRTASGGTDPDGDYVWNRFLVAEGTSSDITLQF